MATHLTLLARLKSKPGKEAALQEALMAMVEPSRAEAGCINYDLHIDQSDESILWVYENWVDAEALVAHTKEPHYRALGEKKDALLAEPVQLTKLTEISKPAQARVPAGRK
jgi:quinol monooxygenase YgiN